MISRSLWVRELTCCWVWSGCPVAESSPRSPVWCSGPGAAPGPHWGPLCPAAGKGGRPGQGSRGPASLRGTAGRPWPGCLGTIIRLWPLITMLSPHLTQSQHHPSLWSQDGRLLDLTLPFFFRRALKRPFCCVIKYSVFLWKPNNSISLKSKYHTFPLL